MTPLWRSSRSIGHVSTAANETIAATDANVIVRGESLRRLAMSVARWDIASTSRGATTIVQVPTTR